MKSRILGLLVLSCLAGAGAAFVYRSALFSPLLEPDETDTVEVAEYRPPPAEPNELLTDDKLADIKPPEFDPELVDRRPLAGGEQVNSSAAVIELDTPLVRPDQEPELLELHASYAKAIGSGPRSRNVLPSVNMIDGKAKQFDDGLYAAIDQAYYQGLEGELQSHIVLAQRLYEAVSPQGKAAAYLAAGLELAGVKVEPVDDAARQMWLREFEGNAAASKPIGFYTWNNELEACFRFLRFFQRSFPDQALEIPLELAHALSQDEPLAKDYRRAVDFYARLSNPYECLSIADLAGAEVESPAAFKALCNERGVHNHSAALFPPSTSRETVLFEKLFPDGLPVQANLMRELVRKIRSGEVDLKPNADSGWYEYQVYALETLLLPERGEEHGKLLLTKAYKKRMLEAFQALITKRRETHARGMKSAAAPLAMPPAQVKPRLRVEPCPSYYLRTARSYAFLADFLTASLGNEGLGKLHGLKQNGTRELPLGQELPWMRDLFYGLYLVSAEDIGLRTSFADGEPLANADEQSRCYQIASDWLELAFQDPDLAVDTRVAVPIYFDQMNNVTRLWATIGVRLARLDANYAVGPRVKAPGDETWQTLESWQLAASSHLIAVDEFAEVELKGLRPLNREELRAVCDREKTKQAIVEALEK
jgi:hypothetical protein